MRIVATKVLRDFWQRHPGAKQHLEAWVDEARKADWRQPADIKVQFRSASILNNRRVVFNISGILISSDFFSEESGVTS
jgi:mRNA interferase HigB